MTSTSTGTKTNTGSMGDTLYLVNTASGTRNFNASSATSTYASKSSPGATNGTTNINGVVSGSNRSALNLSNYAGFSLDGSDIVNLSNMRLYGANSYTANLASANSKLTLNNTVLDGAQVYGSGMVELTGTNTVNAPLNNTGSTTVVSGTTDFNSTVAGFTNNGTVNVGASDITDEVTNNGTLNLSSGTLNYALTNTDTVNNSATINATITNSGTGTFDNDGILAGNVDNSGTLKTAADALLTGSSVTNNGTLELEGGNLTTSLLGTGRMKLMSGGIRLLATTPPTTTGSLSFGDSSDYVDSIATTIRDISSASEHAIATEAAVAAALATAGGGGTWGSIKGTITAQTDLMTHLNNNYYRNNKKSGILGRFEGWKTGNKITNNLSKCHVANENFASKNGDFITNNLSRFGAFAKCEKACPRPSERFPASLEKNSAFEQYSRSARGTFLFVSQTHKNVLDNFYKNSQCLKASNDNFAIITFLRAI